MEVVRLTRTEDNELRYMGRQVNLSPLLPLQMRNILPCHTKNDLARAVQFEAEQIAETLSSSLETVFYDACCLGAEVNPDSFEARGGNLGKKGYATGIQLYRRR